MEGENANTGIKPIGEDDASASSRKPLSKRRREDGAIMPIEFCRRRLENHSDNKIETGSLGVTKYIMNEQFFICTGVYFRHIFMLQTSNYLR